MTGPEYELTLARTKHANELERELALQRKEFEAARLAEEGDEVVFLGKRWKRGPSYIKSYPHLMNHKVQVEVPYFELLPLGDVLREPSMRCSHYKGLPSWDHVYPTLGWRGQ